MPVSRSTARLLCPRRNYLKISRMSIVSFLFPGMFPPAPIGLKAGSMPGLEEFRQRPLDPVLVKTGGPLWVKTRGPV